MKRCSKCGNLLPVTGFHKNPKTKDGLYGHCKKCCAEYQKAYRKKNKEHLRIQKKQYREQNRDRVLARKRAYAESNRERESARAIQWQKDNRDKVIKRSKLRRFRERANGGKVVWSDWLLLCFLFDNRCASCGKKTKLEMDHIIPVASGGSGSISNLQPLCRSCNASKNTDDTDHRTPFIKEWAERRQHENSARCST